jgi:tight adherence protein B
MVAVHTLAVALIGTAICVVLVGVGRRHAVADRFRPGTARGRTLPRRIRAPLGRALDDAALSATPEHAIEVWIFTAGISALVGFGLAPVVGLLAGAGALVGAPVVLRTARRRRARIVAAAVPDSLEQVGAELRAGGTVATALAGIARGESPLAVDLMRVDTRVRLGASLPDALEAWARERPVSGIDATAGALALSTTVGGRAADALEALASSLRARLAVAAEARALSAQARYSAWVIGVAPIAYLAANAVIDPRSVHSLLGTTAGRACAFVGLGLEVLGAVWIRAIVRGGDPA